MTFINIKTQVGDDKNVLLYGISLSLSLSLSLNLYVHMCYLEYPAG